MHAIQTSGNCIRNVTSDQYAGANVDEINTAHYFEIIRQLSTFHPEFSYLPRKFKIAVNGHAHDRAAIKLHDIALSLCAMRLVRLVMRFMLAAVRAHPSLPKNSPNLCRRTNWAYLEAGCASTTCWGVNNSWRTLKFWCTKPARKKTRRLVEAEFALIDAGKMLEVPQAEIDRITRF